MITKRKIAIVLILAAGFAITAVAAFGEETHFVWKIEGKTLKNVSEPYKILKTNENIVYTGKYAGTEVEISCTTASVAPLIGKAEISGERPGTNQEGFTFSGCTVNKPAHCTGSLSMTAMSEIVEGVGAEAGKARLLLTGNGVFNTILTYNLKGETCALRNACLTVVFGSMVGEISNENSEAAKGVLTFPATPITKYKNSAGTEFATSLTSESALRGKIEIELTSGKNFGAYT